MRNIDCVEANGWSTKSQQRKLIHNFQRNKQTDEMCCVQLIINTHRRYNNNQNLDKQNNKQKNKIIKNNSYLYLKKNVKKNKK